MSVRYLFDSSQVRNVDNVKYLLKGYDDDVVEELEEELIYDGPSIDELEAQANAFRRKFEEEKRALLIEQEHQLERQKYVVNEELDVRREEVATEVENARQAWQEEYQAEMARLAEQKEHELEEHRKVLEQEKQQSHDEGYEKGKEEGIAVVLENSDVVIDKLHEITGHILNKRKQIFAEIEGQVIDLLLESIRKIVKTLSQSDEKIVVNNVLVAIRKAQEDGELIVRLNSADVEAVDKLKEKILERVSKNHVLSLVEDHTVDRGGCIIDTDFGSIDARISTQLANLEREIMKLKPIESSGENL